MTGNLSIDLSFTNPKRNADLPILCPAFMVQKQERILIKTDLGMNMKYQVLWCDLLPNHWNSLAVNILPLIVEKLIQKSDNVVMTCKEAGLWDSVQRAWGLGSGLEAGELSVLVSHRRNTKWLLSEGGRRGGGKERKRQREDLEGKGKGTVREVSLSVFFSLFLLLLFLFLFLPFFSLLP